MITRTRSAEYVCYALQCFHKIMERFDIPKDRQKNIIGDLMDVASFEVWQQTSGQTTNDDAGYDQSLKDFLATIFHRQAEYYLAQYLQMYRKPAHITTRSLYERMLTIQRLSKFIPTSFGQGISDDTLKGYFYHMFPFEQRNVLDRSTMTVPNLNNANITIKSFSDFFETFDSPLAVPFHQNTRKRNAQQDNYPGSSSFQRISPSSHHRGRGFNGRFPRRGAMGLGRFGPRFNFHTPLQGRIPPPPTRAPRFPASQGYPRSTGRSGGRPMQTPSTDPNALCPRHRHLGATNHLWRDCILNPSSANYNPNVTQTRIPPTVPSRVASHFVEQYQADFSCPYTGIPAADYYHVDPSAYGFHHPPQDTYYSSDPYDVPRETAMASEHYAVNPGTTFIGQGSDPVHLPMPEADVAHENHFVNHDTQFVNPAVDFFQYDSTVDPYSTSTSTHDVTYQQYDVPPETNQQE